MDGKGAVTLVLQRVGLPPGGDPVHDFVPAAEPGRQAGARERELVDRVGRVQAAHVIGGLADSGLAETLQDLTRAGWLPAECRPPGRHLAVADLPAAGLARDDVVVGDTACRSVGLDADSLGLDPRRAIVDPGDHDVGDVMTDRVGVAQRERGLADGRGPVQRAEAEVAQVVGDIRGEQLPRLVQLARVREVAVEVDQVVDVDRSSQSCSGSAMGAALHALGESFR